MQYFRILLEKGLIPSTCVGFPKYHRRGPEIAEIIRMASREACMRLIYLKGNNKISVETVVEDRKASFDLPRAAHNGDMRRVERKEISRRTSQRKDRK